MIFITAKFRVLPEYAEAWPEIAGEFTARPAPSEPAAAQRVPQPSTKNFRPPCRFRSTPFVV